MKKQLMTLCVLIVLVCILFLSGCSDNNLAPFPDELKGVEQVGQIPDEFEKVVENNVFNGVTAFDGRLLKAEICSTDWENRTVIQQVRMMDVYGKDLAEYTFSSDYAYHVTTLTATEDGGYLFVLGFRDYACSQNEWASDKGFASRVMKFDNSGNLQFDMPLDGVEGAALEYCFEKNGQFYLFGTLQTPETKNRGVYSPTDIYMVILDKNGEVLKSKCIAGSDYDSLNAAEISGSSFVLSCSSQSDDGDFAGSNSKGYPVGWVVTVNDNLEITEKKKESGRDYFDYRLGEKNGVPVYKSNALLNGFNAGNPEAFIDYGDFYLIVSENKTGIYENTPPTVNSTWYYTETVYSAYDYNGKLIFRTSVDSSPEYCAWVKRLWCTLERFYPTYTPFGHSFATKRNT